MEYHIPVLLEPTLAGLRVRPDGCYADLTFGGGGHTRGILERLGSQGRLLAFDQDKDTLAHLPTQDARFLFAHANFRFLQNFVRYYQLEALDGVLADLGVSSHDFDEANRGFSFRFDSHLDMRMNQTSALSAATLLNTYPEERLADLLYLYGELEQARKMARAIVQARSKQVLQTTGELCQCVERFCGKDKKKDLARVFQALRMEVNDELSSLKQALQAATRVVRPGGRLVVITYHSLEDRLVKHFIKTGNFEGRVEQDFFGRVQTPWKACCRKACVPDEQEITINPRSRSAKLRIAEKL